MTAFSESIARLLHEEPRLLRTDLASDRTTEEVKRIAINREVIPAHPSASRPRNPLPGTVASRRRRLRHALREPRRDIDALSIDRQSAQRVMLGGPVILPHARAHGEQVFRLQPLA